MTPPDFCFHAFRPLQTNRTMGLFLVGIAREKIAAIGFSHCGSSAGIQVRSCCPQRRTRHAARPMRERAPAPTSIHSSERPVSRKFYLFKDDPAPRPSCAQFPSDDLCRSTNRDTGPNNAGVRCSDRGGDHRPEGCARHGHELPCRGLLLPFRLHVGTSNGRRRGRAAPRLRTGRAPPSLSLPLLFFQVVESKPFSSLSFCW